MTETVTENPELRRLEMKVDGEVVFATYLRDGDRLVIPHVEAPPALRGKGAADRFMHGLMAFARAEGMRIVPHCGYARAWMRRHAAYRDLIA